ncbi:MULTISPECIES: hypothetical protein [unclassified Virgibacillus]|uniref:hypothetical protein n=1 Tax=unclassified Virgibacillus TaxID=2620237 RepID=UPI00090AB282|nr:MULTISPECIES: hypothetical protein [unclassified Virgibacillus]API91496.1 hypothetical protein BKP57_06355 [Virgibacillus sp. 6R]MBS7426997.1 hypothetical protein [Virgibacillus sp. 19R1-5]
MKKVLVSGLCASLLVANFAGTSALAATKEHSTQTEVTTSVNKEGDVEVPEGYSISVVTNPVTNQSFYRINPVVQTYGILKSFLNTGMFEDKITSILESYES